MSIFNKNHHDVEKFRRNRKYNKLIKLLNHNDPSVKQAAEKALCELKNISRHWSIAEYNRMLKELESHKLSKSRNAIDSFIQTLKKERYVQEEIEQIEQKRAEKFMERLQQSGLSFLLTSDSLENLRKNLKPNEQIEYSTYSGVGAYIFGNCHYIITDRQLIYLDYTTATQEIEYLPFNIITSVKRGLKNCKIFVGEKVFHEFSNDIGAIIVPHLAKFISIEKRMIKKFIPTVYHENIELYAQILKHLKEPCNHCLWYIEKGNKRCIECGKKFYGSSEIEDVNKDLQKMDEWVCKCGTSNPINQSNCSKCRAFQANVAQRSKW
jgi:hypothetical protein